ncbi:MAG: RNA polymerase sigma factor [Bacteroidota bacterium]
MNYPISTEEKDLIDRCLKNDRAAQRSLYMKYKDAMFTILFRILNDREEASDALQDVFVSVFKGLHQFKHQSTIGAWIKTITVRTGIAKQKKLVKMYAEELESIQVSEPVVWPDGLTSEALEKAIAALPDGYRTSFLLIEVEGYTHKEVATMMNKSEGTSKSQLYHAKKALQKILKDYRTG